MRFQNVTHEGTLLITKHYTILVESLLAPLALYWMAKTLHSHRVGVTSLFVLAFIQFPFAPWAPQIGYRPVVIDTFGYLPVVCENCRIAVTGYAQVFADHPRGYWQYAYAAPWVIIAIGLSSKATSRRVSGILGIVLGVIFNLEVVQAALSVTAVGVVLLYLRACQNLLLTALVSLVVSIPTLAIVFLHPKHYFGFGWSLVKPVVPLLVAFSVGVMSFSIWLYYSDQYLSWIKSTPGKHNPPGRFRIPALWSLVLLGFAVVTLPSGTYKIYTQAFYLHKFLLAYWISIGLLICSDRVCHVIESKTRL